MELQNNYRWEIKTNKNTVYTEGNKFDGKVIMVSFIPNNNNLSRHDIEFKDDYIFVRRFCRAFIKQSKGLNEYLHCIITDKFRFYLRSSNGSVIITDTNTELYL